MHQLRGGKNMSESVANHEAASSFKVGTMWGPKRYKLVYNPIKVWLEKIQ